MLTDELRQLIDLHQSGALTDEEFAAAKAKVLAAETLDTQSTVVAPVHRQLEQIQLQNEIERLDREWELEREKYMITGRYGARSTPSVGGSIIIAIVVIGFGLFWTSMAVSIGAPAFFPMFGLIFIILGVAGAISGYLKANEYQEAEERYRARRTALMKQNDGAVDDRRIQG